jgi:hypothetical protein
MGAGVKLEGEIFKLYNSIISNAEACMYIPSGGVRMTVKLIGPLAMVKAATEQL